MQDQDGNQPQPIEPQEPSITPPVPTTPEPEFTPPIAFPPQKSHKKLIIILIIAGFIVLAGIGVAIYLLLQPHKTTTTSPSTTTKAASSKVVTLDSLGDAIKLELHGTVTSPSTLGAPGYNVGTNKYYTGPVSGAKTLAIQSASPTLGAVDADRLAAQDVLTDNGLSLKWTDEDSTDAEDGIYYTTWASDKIVCSIQDEADQAGIKYNSTTNTYTYGQFFFNLSCANVDDYITQAKAIAPYYAAYEASSEQLMSSPSFGVPKTTASETSGYSTSAVSMGNFGAFTGGFEGLFYTTPDGTLHYFLGTQSEPDCSAYNTTDLKKAYLGSECGADGSTAQKVTL